MKFTKRICAFALTLGMAATPVVPLLAQPAAGIQDRDRDRDQDRDRDRDRDHDRDNRWANNKHYRQGMKDADHDRKHNRRREHNRKFKHDDDRQAYEAGYNARWGH